MSIVDHPEAWPADFQDYVFLARAISRLDRDKIWKGLCSGELEAVGSSQERADFKAIPLSRMRFSNQAELKDRVLDDCVIDAMDQRSIRHRIVRRRVPVPHWIYLKCASLDKAVKAAPINVETRATRHLADLLRGNPKMKREDARKEYPHLGWQAFRRVWRDAHTEAGLQPPEAGRPRRK